MKFTATAPKVCELCGETFIPESRAQKCCKKIHTRPCPICSKPVTIKYKSDNLKCCSKKCTAELRRRNNVEVWGVDNPAKAQIVKDKQAATCLDRYGVSTPFLMADFSNKSKVTSIDKYGTEYPMQSDEVKSKIRQTCKERYGVTYATCLPQTRSALLDAYSDDDKLKAAAEKRSRSLSVIASDGTQLDSKYELLIYEFCLRNKLDFTRQVPISFEYNGVTHTTFIDFCIEGKLFECKGSHLLEGCYDHFKYIVPIEVKLKVYADNDVTIITDTFATSWIEQFYDTHLNTKLKFVDVALFDALEFPYRSDRPKCFYDVKVNGHISCYDAFNDEHIRYKMILNRIKYSDRFIDACEIVKALNVTKSAKQPSWFSKSFAKHLIVNYCTSKLIVDPFAGWGSRCDAAKELHRNYVGVDMNEALVDWHHTQGRYSIVAGDARNYKSDGVCSVLMCPPYYDTTNNCTIEDYNYSEFDDAVKQLTECQWLQIVMRNIPNASEYVMVCRTVDEVWQKYVVETKINKSHFGTNTEYVLNVPGASNSMS